MVTVFPTGTTIYDPEKCWNGFTLLHGANLIDMNGRLRREWSPITNHGKLIPDGQVLGGVRDERKLMQFDWDGNPVWEFDGSRCEDMLSVHHDFQREGNPVGYFAPDMRPMAKGRTLILCNASVPGGNLVAGRLKDDRIIEVDAGGTIIWEWRGVDHVAELGLSEAARNTLYRASTLDREYDGLHSPMHTKDPYDWLHSNSVSYVGPNRWYDGGDKRFHPQNIIWDSRDTNITAVISRETGEFTWRLGPDYTLPELRGIGQIVGQHHAHVIPRGLPGEGNVLIFDNGGFAGYGPPNPGAPIGEYNAVRPYSRVVEIDPVSMELKWEYSARTAGYNYHHHNVFYTPYISSAQRLPNGNTMICEGDSGRVFEVTGECETVWEYVLPATVAGMDDIGYCYRAYRVPYDWVPQLKRPKEKAVHPPDNASFHVSAEP